MTAFAINGIATIDGVPTNGLVCVAYLASRFLGTPPVLGSPVPDTNPPDAGPVSSGPSFGGTGHYSLAVPDVQNYWIGCWHLANPNWIAWEGPRMATPHTSVQGWTATASTSVATVGNTSTAAGSNGVPLPTGTIDVASTAKLTASGYVLIQMGGPWTLVAYTGVAGGNSLTGCTGGSGTLATGGQVIQAYVNGAYRRLVMASAKLLTQATSDAALITPISEIGGSFQTLGTVGIEVPGGSTVEESFQMTFPVDPGGAYGFYVTLTGTGIASQLAWNTADF